MVVDSNVYTSFVAWPREVGYAFLIVVGGGVSAFSRFVVVVYVLVCFGSVVFFWFMFESGVGVKVVVGEVFVG